MRTHTVLCGMLLLCPGMLLRADFTFEQKSEVTGGAMAGMMKMAARFSKQAAGPSTTTTMVKGDRMATLSGNTSNIIDLPSESMIAVDFEKKQFSRITFAEMAEAMSRMQSRMQQNTKAGDPQVQYDYKISVDKTSETRQVAGLTARKYILKMQMDMKDTQSQGQGSLDTVSEIWLAPEAPGYQEVRDFYARMANKMSWNPMSGMLGGLSQMNPKAADGMRKTIEEISKMDGMPVRQVVSVGGLGQTPAGSPSGQAAPPPQQQKQEAEAGALSDAVSGRLGRLGGLGGRLGRRKEEPKQQAPAPQAAPAAAPAQTGGSGALMEITSETISFSSAPVDASKLAVPAGFKEVEHPMKKMLQK